MTNLYQELSILRINASRFYGFNLNFLFTVSTLSSIIFSRQLFAVEEFQRPSVPPNPKRKQEGQLTNRYGQLGEGDVNDKDHQRPV